MPQLWRPRPSPPPEPAPTRSQASSFLQYDSVTPQPPASSLQPPASSLLTAHLRSMSLSSAGTRLITM